MPFGFRMAVVPWVAFLLLLCAFAAFGNLWRLGESLRRSRSSAGAFVSHFGLAVLLAGLIVSRGFEREDRGFMRPSQPLSVLGYNVKYREMVGKNLYDRDGKLVLDVTGPDGSQFTATPGFFYNRNLNSGQDEAFVWPHVEREAAHDVYLALGQPIMYAWDGDGLWLKPGETQLRNGIRVTYEKMISEGTPGTESAKFGAQLYVQVMNEDGSVAESHRVTPKLAVQGMTPEMPFVGRDLRAVLYRMDAKDQSAQIQMLFAEPLFPVQVYTKPLTAMVWAGTGILFLGGLMAAVARRRPRPADVEETEDDLSSETPRPQRKPNDAPLPAT
jgi:cytochrome c-type biogenesis protein CcmF